MVKRCGAWGASTSGVEHSFSRQERSQGLHRAEMSVEHVNIDAHVISKLGTPFKSDDEKSEFIERSRRRWASLHGNARSEVRATRSDVGKHHKRKATGKLSETAWLKKRRRQVKHGVEAGTTVQHACDDAYWADGHDKELAFQQQKQRATAVSAYENGFLLTSEVTEDLPARQRDNEMRQAQRWLARQKDHDKHHLQRVQHQPRMVAGSSVFVEPGVSTPSLRAQLHGLGLAVACTRMRADVLVVADPAKPGTRISWCSALGGGLVCDPTYIASGMTRGLAISYKAAIALHRIFCITAAFAHDHPCERVILMSKVTSARSNWKPRTEEEIFGQVCSLPCQPEVQIRCVLV